MTYDEAVQVSSELRARLNAPFSTSDKQIIERLYEAVFLERMKPTSCQSCYHDALIRDITYLRREGKMREKCNYRLRAGFIIKCPLFHSGKIYTNYNLTDAVAEEYLALFPENARMCERITPKMQPKAAKTPRSVSKTMKNERKNSEKAKAEG